MRNLIILVTLLFTVSTMAIEIPDYLKGAKVTVTLKNGEIHTYDSEKMAVVPRLEKKKKLIVKKVICKITKAVKRKKNRIYGIIGYGSTGDLTRSKSGDIHSIKAKRGAVGGVGYMRKLNEKLNLGIQVQTSGTTSLTIGTDF